MRCWLVLGLVTVLIDISIMWLKYSFLAICSFDCCSSSISQIVHFCVVEIGSHFLVGFLSFQLFESDSSQKSIWWPLWATLRDKLRNMREKIMAFSRKWKNIFFNDMKFGRNLYFLVIIISKIRNMILTSCDVITRYLYLLNYDRIFAWKFSLFFFLQSTHGRLARNHFSINYKRGCFCHCFWHIGLYETGQQWLVTRPTCPASKVSLVMVLAANKGCFKTKTYCTVWINTQPCF